DRIEVITYEWPLLVLDIQCGSGTYIRSIARDVGETLGCGGLMLTLLRSRIGPFTSDEAVDPRELGYECLARHLRPSLEAVGSLPRLLLDRLQIAAIASGRKIQAGDLCDASVPVAEVALLDPDGRLIALADYNPAGGWVQPRKVLI